MTESTTKRMTIFRAGVPQWAGFAIALAPWFWMADILVDLPLTLAAMLFAITRWNAFKASKGSLGTSPMFDAWTLGFGALWLLFIIAASLGLRPDASLPLAILWLRHPMFLAAILLWLSAYPTSEEERRKTWSAPAWSFTLSGIFIAFDSLLQWQIGQDLFGRPLHSASRLTGPFNEPIVGFVLVHLTPVLISMALVGLGPFGSVGDPKRRSWPVFAAGLFCLGVISAAILLSGERLFAGWQVLGLSGLFVVLLFSRTTSSHMKRVLLSLGLLAALVVGGFISTSIQPALRERLVDRTQAEISGILLAYQQREIVERPESAYANIHLRAAEALAHDPLTGQGMLGFRYYCPAILGINNTNLNGCSTHPHQTWLAIGIAGGWPALLLTAVLLAGFLANRWRALANSRRQAVPLALAYLPLWAIGPMILSPLNSEGFFINFTENLFWSGLGLCLAMERYIKHHCNKNTTQKTHYQS